MPNRRFSFCAALIAAAGLTLSLTGCPDPEGAFEDFATRYDDIHKGTGGSGGGAGGGEACTPATEGELDGHYMFTISARLSPKKAFALDATFTTHDDGAGGLTADLDLQPLSKDDQTTPVGTVLSFTNLPVGADGNFTWDFGMVTLPGVANPITGSDVVTTLVLTGQLCAGDRAGFVCGEATGTITEPLMADLSPGSGFTMQAADGGTLPPPVINCAMDPAVY